MSLHVLGRDVAGGTEELLGEGDGGEIDDLGDAEVGELHQLARIPPQRAPVTGALVALGLGALVGHQDDVLRFEVAMDDAELVRPPEGARDLRGHVGGARPREDALLDVRQERLAGDVLHDEVGDAVGLSHVGDLDDVPVVDAIDGLRLAEEPLAIGGARSEVGAKDLDRRESVDDHVPRQVDDAHPAGAEALDQAIAGGDGATEVAVLGTTKLGAVLGTEGSVFVVHRQTLGTHAHPASLSRPGPDGFLSDAPGQTGTGPPKKPAKRRSQSRTSRP